MNSCCCKAGWICLAWLVGMGLVARAADEPGSELERPQFTDEERSYWSYQPVRRPEVPKVAATGHVRTPIDAFLLTKLDAAGIPGFSAEASKRELLRRAKFDLLGLPPTPEEVAEFEADQSPSAYEKLIDRLLSSPHYGERWGRVWLDLVRFADTAGFNADPVRPHAYQYRDYVIRSFNRDTPYDRFVQEQLAGDEMFPDDPEALIGSGYNRLWPDELNASNVLLARQDILNDLTSNVGSVFLGVSIGCAQCHDHKFDPLPQADFYRLQAFFAGIIPVDRMPVGVADELVRYRDALNDWRSRTAAVRHELRELDVAAYVRVSKAKRNKFPKVVLDAIDTLPEDRTTLQHQLAFFSERQLEKEKDEKKMQEKMTAEERQRRTTLREQLDDLEKQRPLPPKSVAGMLVCEDPASLPATRLLSGGRYNRPQEVVRPGFLSILLAPGESWDANVSPVAGARSSGRRSTLARWVTSPSNPLTTRVMVNRLWQSHFGRGLVENANDFGIQGPAPTHPDLLDWLAAELVSPTATEAPGPAWGLKRMHRLIMLSAAYRQQSRVESRSVIDKTARGDGSRTSGAGGERDPGNTLYWHFPRRRLEAEMIRDAMLAVSGLLNDKLFGPAVQPPLPAGFTTKEPWKKSNDEADWHRRSIYTLARRNLPYPFLQAFDLPDMAESCACRQRTTIAPQALMLLNGDLVLGYAQAFAGRLIRDPARVRTGVQPLSVRNRIKTGSRVSCESGTADRRTPRRGRVRRAAESVAEIARAGSCRRSRRLLSCFIERERVCVRRVTSENGSSRTAALSRRVEEANEDLPCALLPCKWMFD
jgi:hypothetical protein